MASADGGGGGGLGGDVCHFYGEKEAAPGLALNKNCGLGILPQKIQNLS